jgi:hypothetical protein
MTGITNLTAEFLRRQEVEKAQYISAQPFYTSLMATPDTQVAN